jgi:L-threonylcarbamoyladenylate synthase
MEQDIKECVNVLNQGGLILYPTDTIWGIGCDATDEAAVEIIFELKKRPAEKSMIVLMASEKDILKYTGAPDLAAFDFLSQTKKPTTMIFDMAIGLAPNLVGADGSIGIRLVRDAFCQALLKRFQKPIVSTSANESGNAAPAFYKDISDVIKNGVDYIVHHRRDDEEPRSASAVVRWKNGVVEVIRH